MSTHDALGALGVTDNTLTAAERDRLDRDGYVALEGVLTNEQIVAMNARIDELVALEGADAGKEVHQEVGATRLSNLVDKSSLFDICFTHPRVLAGISHVLGGDLKLSSLNFRAALPGHGLQPLHGDWDRPVAPDEYQVCNSIWLLDDFTEHNGATRVVPGSHRSGALPGDATDDPSLPHPDEVMLLGPAGTVVVFNSHTWHGGTLNRTEQPRRALHSYFCRRVQPQQLDQADHLSAATKQRLSAAARYVLDV